MFRLPCLLLAVVALLSSACSSEPELAIDLRSDLTPAVEIDRVLVTVDGAAEAPRPIARDALLSRGVRIYEGRLSSGRHTIHVALSLAGVPVLSRDYVVQLDSSLIMAAVFTRDCRGVECPGSGGSAMETECLAGRCVEVSCVAPGDPSCPPDLGECTAAGDCDEAAACASATCNEGLCFEVSSCPAGSSCDFESAMCAPDDPSVDAGPGVVDAGIDGGSDAPSDAGEPTLACASRACAGVCPPPAYDVSILDEQAVAGPVFADLDGDAVADLVAVAGIDVVQWRGDGAGYVHQSRPVLSAPRGIARVFEANIDGDELPDLIEINSDCIEGHLPPSWLTTVSACVPFTYSVPMAVGDLDADTRSDDVMVASPLGVTPLVLNQGREEGFLFTTHAEIPIGASRAIALGDLDGDGRLDAVVAREDSLVVLLQGTSTTFTVDATYPLDAATTSVRIARVFCDAHPSVIVDDEGGAAILYRNDGDTLSPTRLPGGPSAGFVLTDVNGDALLDLLVAEPGAGIRVLAATGWETFRDDGLIDAASIEGGLEISPDGHLVSLDADGHPLVFIPR